MKKTSSGVESIWDENQFDNISVRDILSAEKVL